MKSLPAHDLPEADRIHKSLQESSQAEVREPRDTHDKGRNFTIRLL